MASTASLESNGKQLPSNRIKSFDSLQTDTSGYKYAQFAVPPNVLSSNQNSTVSMIKAAKFEKTSPPFNSLAAATAAAAAAVAAQQQQYQQQQTLTNLYDESKARLLSKGAAEYPASLDHHQAYHQQHQPKRSPPIYDESMKQRSPTLLELNNQQPVRRNSFSKATTSPNKYNMMKPNVAASRIGSNQPSTHSIEDNEMLSSSSSASSASSYKENKLPAVSNGDGQNADQSSPSKEPSKLSLSEKMKLFSNPNQQLNRSFNTENAAQINLKATTPNNNKIKRNNIRFQTQVIDFFY